MNSVTTPYRPPSEHYENFPVASWLCPPKLRRPIASIYWFARTADDIADEGAAAPAQRLDDLAVLRHDLLAMLGGQADSGRWRDVLTPLLGAIQQFALPLVLLTDLLDAFEQDVVFTAGARRYETDRQLHDYCRRSANPIGRLLLHLYRVQDEDSLKRSDQICTALQLINFWQDLRVDVARERWYPSLEQMALHGVREEDLRRDAPCPRASGMIAAYADRARAMMIEGAGLAHRIPGRAGWELRLVVQGGLRILEKMQAMGYTTWRQRPKLARGDFPVIVWRAFGARP